MRKSITRAAAVAAGACAVGVTAATIAPAATSATLPKYYNVQSAGTTMGPGQAVQVSAGCKTGDHATGGGYSDGSESALITVEQSEPRDLNNAPVVWVVDAFNNGTQLLQRLGCVRSLQSA